jgi:hypothetical protein
MLTADQIRLKLRKADSANFDVFSMHIIDLLNDVLPDLIEENERLRQSLHLSELSRGTPSPVGRD